MDGDLISQKHFQALESWVETSVQVARCDLQNFGLVSITPAGFDYNDQDKNIKFRPKEDSKFEIILSNWYAITPRNQVICIGKPQHFELDLDNINLDEDDFFNLYIRPITNTELKKLNTDSEKVVEGNPALYSPYVLETVDSGNQGVCLCRFNVRKDEILLDPDFVPMGIDLVSSPQLRSNYNSVIEKVDGVRDRLKTYLQQKSQRGVEEFNQFTMHLFRSVSWHRSFLSSRNNINTTQFFLTLQTLFDHVLSELDLLAIMYKDIKDEANLQKSISNFSNLVSRPMFSFVDRKVSLSIAFVAIEERFNALNLILANFPEFPSEDTYLDIKKIEFKEHDGVFNKLGIHFEKEHELNIADSLILELDHYSRQEPTAGKIRVTVEDREFAKLKAQEFDELTNKPSLGVRKDNDYQITCTARYFETLRVKTLTIYIPSPLGENIEKDKHLERIRCRLLSVNTNKKLRE